MLHKFLPANPALTDRFGHLLYLLFAGMDADWRRRGLRHVHHGEITQRLLGLWKRLRSVLERYRAGTLRARTSPRPSPQSGEGEAGAARAARQLPGWGVLPRRFGWLKSLILPESQICVTAFHALLFNDADMQAVIAAAPGQIGRVLRPFCHFLGLEVPAELRLPKRVRVRKKDTSPRPSPHSGEVEGDRVIPNRRLAPREQAEDAVRRSEASGKPIALERFSPEAFGWWAHPPRDGNCPPPKIGYGGRLRPLPKDYRPPKDDE